jgi:indolepyruvate ferredoxin oxidoreductase alpha subunit
LVKKKELLLHASEKYYGNKLILSEKKTLGIVACGIAYNYVMENIAEEIENYSIIKIAQYPVPKSKLRQIYEHCDSILVVEEGYPMVEELLHDYFDTDPKVKGKLSGHLPMTGELNPNNVGLALGLQLEKTSPLSELVAGRPPQLCEGCGHTDLFKVIEELLPEIGEKKIFGDIGCYALGALAPVNMINTLIDMGASITMAKGAADSGVENAIAVIGDSTFSHSGMTGLLEAVNENSPITVVISDNSAVAMTGAQDSMAVGRLQKICVGLGVEPDHVKLMVPLRKNFSENLEILRGEVNYKGVSVIISQRPCVQLPRDQKEKIKEKIASLH